MIEFTKYLKREGFKENEQLKVSIYFEKNAYVTGYYVTVVPVTISKRENFTMEEFGAYTGFKKPLLACNRRSGKRLDIAIDNAFKNEAIYLEYFNPKKDADIQE
jgi:hypothetical protein